MTTGNITLARRLEDATLRLLEAHDRAVSSRTDADEHADAAARKSLWRLVRKAFAGDDLVTTIKAAQCWADVGHAVPDEMLEAAAAKWIPVGA